ITAVPLVGLTLVIVSVSPSGSLSLARAAIVTGTSSTVVAKSSTATGASLLPLVTVTVIRAEAVPPLPSLMLSPMVAGPKKSAVGVNTTLVPEMTAVPLVGLTLVIVSVSPSGSLSLARAAMLTGTSSTVVAKSFTATGASLLPLVTVTVIRAEAVPPLPSLML